ncbi:MAG: hypothetical protein NTY45_13280 [Elusimicrobia bacterium]|nr:hypothetical protein [Elusimicrobiota bacterium]
MGTIFSKTLTKFRKEAGSPTAYRFYHDNGGGPVLKMTYGKYLRMEQGGILPVPERLQKLIVALRLDFGGPQAYELITSWLKTKAGEDAYTHILAPALSSRQGTPVLVPASPCPDGTHSLTAEQFRLMLSSFDTYKCALVLNNDTGAWSAAELAAALKIKKPAAERSLKLLTKAGLARKAGKGLYRSLLSGKTLEYPQLPVGHPVKEKLDGYVGKLETSGSLLYQRDGVIRADAAKLRGFFPFLEANLSSARGCAVTGKTERSAFFSVTGKVLRLLDF